MKFRTDKDVLQFLGMGFGLILFGVVIFLYLHPAGIGLTISGTIITLIGLRIATKSKEFFMQDERSTRINEKAGYHAFWATMAVISIAYFLKVTKLWDPTFWDMYSITLFTGIYGWIILRWYFNKKGE